jgi:hypothetical protein
MLCRFEISYSKPRLNRYRSNFLFLTKSYQNSFLYDKSHLFESSWLISKAFLQYLSSKPVSVALPSESSCSLVLALRQSFCLFFFRKMLRNCICWNLPILFLVFVNADTQTIILGSFRVGRKCRIDQTFVENC